MTRLIAALLALAALLQPPAAPGATWSEGVQYVRLAPPQQTTVPSGKAEVMEVFSYGCPACNAFQPVMEKLRRSLPANAQLVYLPAAFNPAEDWPMFQRAFYAAQTLGIAEKTHVAMYDAIWKTGELSVVDKTTNQLRNPLPSIADAADFYQRKAGIKKEDFLAAASSFGVDVKVKRADALVIAYGADSTPTIIVNGKYRLSPSTAGGYNQLSALIKYLVAQETK